ncbi:hypothetical protein FO519_002063 [Halicephalobus sp. NKZ332]|nr:hypothetical protein FO519_002063 [Halicephalobus sp. NKZ332]
MVHYKLYYFNVRGRGEAIRQVFALAKVPFDDHRLELETWGSFKEETPFGQVPVLEVDGVKIANTNAILRYLGREFNLAGSNNLENAKIDSLGDLLIDAQLKEGIREFGPICLGFTKADKDEFFKLKIRPALTQVASSYEKFLVENGGAPLAIDKVTWVDILAAEFFSKFIEYGEKDALEAYPHIMELIDRIHNLPEIKQHISKRQHSDF